MHPLKSKSKWPACSAKALERGLLLLLRCPQLWRRSCQACIPLKAKVGLCLEACSDKVLERGLLLLRCPQLWSRNCQACIRLKTKLVALASEACSDKALAKRALLLGRQLLSSKTRQADPLKTNSLLKSSC